MPEHVCACVCARTHLPLAPTARRAHVPLEQADTGTSSRATKRSRAAGGGGGGGSSGGGGDAVDWRALAATPAIGRKTVKDLKEYLSSQGLRVGGRKAELIDRIKEHLGV